MAMYHPMPLLQRVISQLDNSLISCTIRGTPNYSNLATSVPIKALSASSHVHVRGSCSTCTSSQPSWYKNNSGAFQAASSSCFLHFAAFITTGGFKVIETFGFCLKLVKGGEIEEVKTSVACCDCHSFQEENYAWNESIKTKQKKKQNNLLPLWHW